MLSDLPRRNIDWSDGRTPEDPGCFPRLAALQAPEFFRIGCADSRMVDFDDRVSAGHVAGLAGADGLILLPDDADRLPRGALVAFQPFTFQ